ncbi:MAG: hypothetical protein HC923_03915 [Myxococcales bacterium]|nr:hypothetical protein [Myxococcales bacterium]
MQAGRIWIAVVAGAVWSCGEADALRPLGPDPSLETCGEPDSTFYGSSPELVGCQVFVGESIRIDARNHSLEVLSSMEWIEGGLWIRYGFDGLETLQGLEKLEHVGDLRIVLAPNLKNLDALSSLRSVEKLFLQQLENLESVHLPALKTVESDGWVALQVLPKVASIRLGSVKRMPKLGVSNVGRCEACRSSPTSRRWQTSPSPEMPCFRRRRRSASRTPCGAWCVARLATTGSVFDQGPFSRVKHMRRLDP